MRTFKKLLFSSISLFIFALSVTLVSAGSASAQIDPGATAFQQEGVENSTVFYKRFDFVVPGGKRLVIEKLSAVLEMPHQGQGTVSVIGLTELQTTVNGSSVKHEFGKPIFNTIRRRWITTSTLSLRICMPTAVWCLSMSGRS